MNLLFFIYFSFFLKENPLTVDSILEQLWRENYTEVRKKIQAIEKRVDKKDPLVNLLKVIYLYHYLQDFKTLDSEKVFLKEIERTVKKAGSFKGNEEENLWGYFSKAVALSYLAMWIGDKGDYLSAISKGLEAVNLFSFCIEKNFFIKDGYLALGIYNYAVSVIQKYTGKVFFQGDRKEEGISQVEKAYREGIFMKPVCALVLIFIYSRERRAKEAVEIAKAMRDKYPYSRTFLWNLARAYRADGYWKDAYESYLELYENIEKEQKNFYYSRALVRYWLSYASYILGENERAKNWLKNIDSFIKKSNWYEKDNLKKRIEKLKKKLSL